MALRFNGNTPTGVVGSYSAFPGRMVGTVSVLLQQTNMVPLWSANRNQTAAFGELAGQPDGTNHPVSWLMPLQAGRVSARGAQVTFTPAANGTMGLPASGSATITFTVPAAQLQLVVSTSGSSSISFTVGGTVAGALLAQGLSAIAFTVDAATLGAIVDATGESQVAFSEAAVLTALGNISGAVTPFTELSPESLAAAVWNAIATEYNLVGTMGELLNSGGGGGGGGGGGVTAAQIWSYATRTLTASPGPSAATIATQVRTELTTELNRIDADVSSRLPTASYTAPPSISAIRTEMDTNSTKLDVAISTRNATAPDNAGIAAIKARTDNLPASPAAVSDIPSAATNAAAVRTNLTTELGRIDVAISSRNAVAPLDATATASAVTTALNSYDPPTKAELDSAQSAIIAALPAAAPTASQNASAVRTELTTELGRIDAAVSSRNATAPDNAGISAIKAKTDNLPTSPASEGKVQEAVDAANLAVALSA
jgi:hypothetical protein